MEVSARKRELELQTARIQGTGVTSYALSQPRTNTLTVGGVDGQEEVAERKLLKLLRLKHDLGGCEEAVLQAYTDCMMLDTCNHLSAHRHLATQAHAVLQQQKVERPAGVEQLGSDGEAAASASTGGQRRQRLLSHTNSSNFSASLAGLSSEERQQWAKLAIRFEDLVIDKRVGSGASGVVHKGYHQGQDVAIKLLIAQDEMSEDDMKDFREEVKWLSQIRCAYIVLLIGVCITPGSFAVVTEFMPRGSMYEILHKTKSDVGFPRRMRMLLDVIKGMQYLEASKIVHRDLKSQNLLIDRSFRVKVADFGLARLSTDSCVQTSNGAAGTPAWMAPETLRDDAITPKSDVYAFGVVVWETVMRRIPWHGMRNAQIVCGVGLRGDRLPLEDMVGALVNDDPYLRSLCTQCFQEDPCARPRFEETCASFTAFMQRLLRQPKATAK